MNGSMRAAAGPLGWRVHPAGGGTGTVDRVVFSFDHPLGQSEAPVPVLPQSQGMGMAEQWPLRTFPELGALPGAVPCARLHARHVLWEWGLEAFTEPVGLVVSELVTNAVQASEGLTSSQYDGRWTPGVPPVRLW